VNGAVVPFPVTDTSVMWVDSPDAPNRWRVAIALAFVAQRVSLAIYVAVALLWFVPDRHMETLFSE